MLFKYWQYLKKPLLFISIFNLLCLNNVLAKKSPFLFQNTNNYRENFYGFSIPQDPNIKKWITFFTSNRGKKIIQNWTGNSRKYFYFIEKSIKKNNLPLVLAYLPMIESGFYVHAHSSAGAVGYWQFMKPTAKRFNLKVSHWLDERKNIHKSTIAALNYLKILYKRFKKWELALAAYNMGENRLGRFIKKYKTTNYWELINKPDFPKETKNYIPKLIAVSLVLQQSHLYGMNIKITSPKQKKFNYISIAGGTSLKNLANSLNVHSSYLKKINPELKQFRIPHYVESYAVRIPPKSFKTIENYFKK
ncbi:MAG: lytic transglycosylase domain-containing protein [Bdellovibrionaceae bacterium]|nr:lytic transglycosylase domain-containing protein [Pseudobdellovibrionaceae bacterium]